MSAAFVSLCIFGAFFFYTGVHSLCRPKQFGEMLSLQPIGRSGLIEIRAQYGGFFLAAALSQFAGLTALISIQTSFIVSLIIFGGLITGRPEILDLEIKPMVFKSYQVGVHGLRCE